MFVNLHPFFGAAVHFFFTTHHMFISQLVLWCCVYGSLNCCKQQTMEMGLPIKNKNKKLRMFICAALLEITHIFVVGGVKNKTAF